jgi:signal transduction histidine kinase
MVEGVEARWRGSFAEDGRRLEVQLDPDLATAPVSARLVRHVLDALLENALAHGRGRVRLVARPAAGALAVEVVDEGQVDPSVSDPFERGVTTGDGAGVGLSMARTMAVAAGARLLLSERCPTRFTLFLPRAAEEKAGRASRPRPGGVRGDRG